MSPVNFIKWTANQCLNQKNIEVAEVHLQYLEDTKETQFTLVTPDGKIGVCKVSNDEFTVAVQAETVRDFLTPRFESIEFTTPEPAKEPEDGQPPVPEVQPGPSKPKSRKRKSAKAEESDSEDGEAKPDSTDAGSSEPEAETEGDQSDAGPATVETGE